MGKYFWILDFESSDVVYEFKIFVLSNLEYTTLVWNPYTISTHPFFFSIVTF